MSDGILLRRDACCLDNLGPFHDFGVAVARKLVHAAFMRRGPEAHYLREPAPPRRWFSISDPKYAAHILDSLGLIYVKRVAAAVPQNMGG
jgi:hypothetical protein